MATSGEMPKEVLGVIDLAESNSPNVKKRGHYLADGLTQKLFNDLEAGPDLVIRSGHLSGQLDLSFRNVRRRLIFVDCVLKKAPTFEGADLAGLELHRCKVSRLKLDQAHVRSDLRLVDLKPLGVDSGKGGVRVTAAGTLVDGRVDLSGSYLDDASVDVLVASAVAAPQVEPGGPTGNGVNWDPVLQIAGLAAGLAAWAAVVGGARLWARMVAIDAPALPALAGLGQGWMVAEGLQTLLVPMLLGIVVALLVYFTRLKRSPTDASPMNESYYPPAVSGPKSPDKRGNSSHSSWRRSRPLVTLRRLRRSTLALELLVVGLFGLLAVGLLVAQASWPLLLCTVSDLLE